MVGEVAVHFAIKLGHFAANGPQNRRGRRTGHAVAAIDHDFQGAGQADVAYDFRGVRGQHVGRGASAAALQGPGFVHHHLAQGLDFVAVNGFAAHHHFEAVVITRVVAAGDLTTAAAQGASRKVEHGRGDHAHVNHLHTHLLQAAHQRVSQAGAAQAPVATHRHRGLPLAQRHRAKSATQLARDVFVHRGRHDAADVIGFEDAGGNGHVGLSKFLNNRRQTTQVEAGDFRWREKPSGWRFEPSAQTIQVFYGQ